MYLFTVSIYPVVVTNMLRSSANVAHVTCFKAVACQADKGFSVFVPSPRTRGCFNMIVEPFQWEGMGQNFRAIAAGHKRDETHQRKELD